MRDKIITRNEYQDIFRQMEREMIQLTDEVFRGFFDKPNRHGRFWQPHVDIYETESSLQVNVELPGVKADDISVSLSPDERFVTIAGVRKEADGEREGRLRCHQLEIYFGPFERTIGVPQHIRLERESVRANYREGFLFVTLPKKPATEQEATKIPVTISSDADLNGTESRATNDRS